MKHDTRSLPLVRVDQLRAHPANRPAPAPILDGYHRDKALREQRRHNRLEGLRQLDQDSRDIFG